MSVLKDYEKASWQLINASKSSISFSSKCHRRLDLESNSSLALIMKEVLGSTSDYQSFSLERNEISSPRSSIKSKPVLPLGQPVGSLLLRNWRCWSRFYRLFRHILCLASNFPWGFVSRYKQHLFVYDGIVTLMPKKYVRLLGILSRNTRTRADWTSETSKISTQQCLLRTPGGSLQDLTVF